MGFHICVGFPFQRIKIHCHNIGHPSGINFSVLHIASVSVYYSVRSFFSRDIFSINNPVAGFKATFTFQNFHIFQLVNMFLNC